MRRFSKWSGCLMLTLVTAAASAMSSNPNPSLDHLLPTIPKPRVDYSNTDIRPASERDRDSDPLKYLADDLDRITGDLSSLQTAKPVQDEQAQALRRMDALIAELEKACAQAKSGGANPNPTSPMTSSRLTGGPGGEGALHAPKEGSKNWGDLPAREREQILQARTEGFPAGYEGLLESYYRRLSQEQVTPEAATAQPPSHPADSTGHEAGRP